MNEKPTYDLLAQALVTLGIEADAAQYHGALCGALCVQPAAGVELAGLLGDAVGPGLDAQSLDTLRTLRDVAAEDLLDESMSFMPLLPPDDAALTVRVQALASWCDGFLFGLVTRRSIDFSQCSAEAQEILRDFTELTRAALGEGDDFETEESAYTELVEYIRVGAQLIYMELRHPPADPDAPSQTLH